MAEVTAQPAAPPAVFAPRQRSADPAQEVIALVRPTPVPRRRLLPRPPRLVRRAVGPLLLLAVWQLLCSEGVFPSFELASPLAVVDALRQLWSEGVFQANLLITLRRVGEGLFFGVSIGVALAAISGLFRIAEDLIDPVIQAMRAVPILGLLPLIIIWLGVGELPKVFLIALGCVFPIYLNTYGAIRNVDVKLVEAGQTFGLNHWGLVRRVILPGSVPGFLVGLRFALVGSWMIDVVAEEINAQSGLGYLINQAQTTNRTDIMFLCLACYAIIGLLADAIVRGLDKRLLAWRRGFAGA